MCFSGPFWAPLLQHKTQLFFLATRNSCKNRRTKQNLGGLGTLLRAILSGLESKREGRGTKIKQQEQQQQQQKITEKGKLRKLLKFSMRFTQFDFRSLLKLAHYAKKLWLPNPKAP